jgi:hypothetical protein
VTLIGERGGDCATAREWTSACLERHSSSSGVSWSSKRILKSLHLKKCQVLMHVASPSPRKRRGLRRRGLAGETPTFFTSVGAVLEGPAKGSTSSSGKDSVVSIMTSSQSKAPSVLLTAIDERLARRPLTDMLHVGEAGEEGFSIVREN